MRIHRGTCVKQHPPNLGIQQMPPPDDNPITAPTNLQSAVPVADLPSYAPVTRIPTKAIYNMSGAEFTCLVDQAYSTIIKWRTNLFKLPTGKAGKEFITELTSWLHHYNCNTKSHAIALKVYFTLPALLLQKPSRNSKAKDHLKKLEERIGIWREGNIQKLIQEGNAIQEKLVSGKQRTPDEISKSFAKLMLQGKINAALNLLSTENGGGVLPLTDQVLKDLQEKHPPAAPIQEGALILGPVNNVPPSYFDSIDEQMIAKAAQQTKGAGGPSHCDAKQYRHILLSNKFKSESKALREQISLLGRKLATSILDPTTLEAFICCRLLPLDKCPGIRPIGIGEVMRRLIGKSIGWVLKKDMTESAGPLQASGGLQGGAEAAIHAMKEIFDMDDTDAVILVDASNAFNTLNRQVALHNVQRTC